MEEFKNKIILGDCLEKLKELESDSVDSIVTDPPYGYSFMGKDWDKAVPSVEVWQECLRVLKPGGFAFVMSAPRSDVQMHMIKNLEAGGFDIGFTPLYHTYASGFPKAQNVHKKLSKDQEARKHELQELWRAIIYSATPDEQNIDRPHLPSLLEDLEQGTQCEITSQSISREEMEVSERQRKSFLERWTDLSEKKRELRKCKACSLPTGILINGKKRWVCYGTSSSDGKVSWTAIDEDGMCTSYKSQLSRQQVKKSDVVCEQCGTQAVRTFDGAFSGFQVKPAVEVILVCMKPLSEKTYVDQALKNGKGITWLDDCRVPTSDENAGWNGLANKVFEHSGNGTYQPQHNKTGDPTHTTGRFPANLLVSDDVLNDGRITSNSRPNHTGRKTDSTSAFVPNYRIQESPKDSGSYSRYFDLDKWASTLPFLICAKASKSEKNRGLEKFEETTVNDGRPIAIDNAFQRGKTKRVNSHPTVKPLKLMSYLITLGSRPGDTILDPFSGSCTTLVAAKELKRNYIGIERESEYVSICEARLEAVPNALF